MALVTPTIAWVSTIADHAPDFSVLLGEPGDVIAGQNLHFEYTTNGGQSWTDYVDHVLLVSDLVDLQAQDQAAFLGHGTYQFRSRLETDTENGDWSNTVTVTIGADSNTLFSGAHVQELHKNRKKLQEIRESRSKDKGEKARNLREAVEALYDNLAGIAPAAAAKVAAVIPAKAKVTETAARAAAPELPAIDWSKVTSAQIAKVIATMDAYAAQLDAEQRQQAIARDDAARDDEDDIETLLMALQ